MTVIRLDLIGLRDRIEADFVLERYGSSALSRYTRGKWRLSKWDRGNEKLFSFDYRIIPAVFFRETFRNESESEIRGLIAKDECKYVNRSHPSVPSCNRILDFDTKRIINWVRLGIQWQGRDSSARFQTFHLLNWLSIMKGYSKLSLTYLIYTYGTCT